MKNTKRALGISLLALLLCVSMFVGTTFAWFTDSVTVAGNKIQAGTLDIELWKTEYNDYMDQPGEEGFVEKNITNDAAPIFNSDLWEPGYLAYTNLTVKNVGTLAAKIKANLVATSEVGKLAEVIDVYVAYLPLADYYDGKTIRQLFNREIFWGPESWGMNMFDMNVKHVGTLKDVMEQGIDLALFNNESALIEAGDEYQINIALKMQETAGNEYQGQTAGTFDIRVMAAQATVESDSFDNLYDEKAEYPVIGQAALDEALAKGVNFTIEGGEFAGDIRVNAGQTVNIDDADINGRVIIENDSTVVINNAEVVTDSMYRFEFWSDGKLVINDGTYASPANSNSSCLFNNYGSDVEIVINGGEFTMDFLTMNSSAGTTVVINGGTFDIDSVLGWNFADFCTIYGGTFTSNPADYANIGAGCTVTDNGDGTWTVA